MASGCRRPCEHQRQVLTVQGVRPLGASDSSPECVTFLLWSRDEYALCQTVQKTGDSPDVVLGRMWCRGWYRQCRKP